MQWEIMACPQCGDPPVAILEVVQAEARLFPSDGLFEYEGDTEVLWDTQKRHVTQDGQHTLRCSEGHSWETKPIEEQQWKN